MYLTPKKIKCKKCGKETLVGSGAGKFCSECKIINKREWRREHHKIYRHKARQDKHLVCKICKKDLTNEPWAKEYCHNCRPKSVKIFSHDYYLKNREHHLAYTKAYYQVPEHKAKHRIDALNYLHRQKIKLSLKKQNFLI